MPHHWLSHGRTLGRNLLLSPPSHLPASCPPPSLCCLVLCRRRVPPAWQHWAPVTTVAFSHLPSARHLHLSRSTGEKELHRPSSKVEETVDSLLEQIKGQKQKEQAPVATTTVVAPTVPTPDVAPPKAVATKRTLWMRFLDELRHYYHGSKLLVINVNVSRKLVGRLLRGESLTRREHRQLVRTVGDLFRVVPFSVFIIIPFMELLLPVFIKLFPNMLPSTFQTANEQEAKMKQKLKIKLETAKFLQKTLDSMALKGKGHYSEAAKDFAEFFKEIRSSGEQATNDQIMRFSKLFEDELTLDSLQRPELTALCRVLEVQTFGTNNILRFIIQMKLRRLAADDRVIFREGVDSLTIQELQHAVRARGMRAYGVSELRLRSQLSQWVDLSLNEKVPPSLLLLSRALYLSENIPAEDQLKVTISRLPESLGTVTRAAIGEREGRVDFKTRVDVIKEEERRIREELEERQQLEASAAAAAAPADPAAVDITAGPAATSDPTAVDLSVDRAPVLTEEMATTTPAAELTSRDMSDIEDALQNIAADKHKTLLEREELADIKEEMADYKEDLDELKSVVELAGEDARDLRETKAARRLFKGVNKLIGSLDGMIEKLQDKRERIIAENDQTGDAAASSGDEVGIHELIQSLKHIQGLPDQAKLDVVTDVLSRMDNNQDGLVRVEDVYDVMELISQENMKLTAVQMKEIIDLLDREKVQDLERRIEKALSKETEASASSTISSSESAAASSKTASSQSGT